MRLCVMSQISNPKMHNYRELKIWQKSIDLAVDIYKMTSKFPKEEMYGLTSQLRRAGVSIASNIAEGAYRNSDKEFVHSFGISNGSAAEVDTQLEIAQRLGLIVTDDYAQIADEMAQIQKMNYKLQETLKRNFTN